MNKFVGAIKTVGKMASPVAGIGVTNLITPLIKPTVDFIIDNYNEYKEERKKYNQMPNLFPSDCQLTIEDAKEMLDLMNIKYKTISVRPNIKFKDCFNLELIGASKKTDMLVSPETLVILKYITTEVIEESKQLFDEQENMRKEERLKKKLKKV